MASKRNSISIEDAKSLAFENQGHCLSEEYVNNSSKLKWRCKHGHEWETSYSVVKSGHWCPKCAFKKNADNQRHSIEKAQDLAIKKGGVCLSNKYKNARSKLKWRCKKGHVWFAPYDSIRSGRWCAACAGKKLTTKKDLDAIAKKQGGKCLTKVYKPKEKILWECSKGHKFKSLVSSAKKGHWCPTCANRAPITRERVVQLAKERKGKCLSNQIKSARQKLQWRCGNGHSWKASYNSVSKGSWCPICSQGLGERLCRKYFEAAFNAKFPNTRGLSWLVNKSGSYLELDGYNQKLKLAFEHQGEHHYSKDHYFAEAKYDSLKKKLCNENDILLIEVPAIGNKIELKDLPDLISNELIQANKNLIKFPKISDVDFSDAYHPKWMDELKKIAKEKGGKCLSSVYLGNNKKLKWICKNGHTWMSSPEKIKRGDWCDKCARIESGKKRALNIEEARQTAIQMNGKCLSDSYKNNRTKMKWECQEGHVWEAVYSNIKKGHWCPVCANKSEVKKIRYNIEDAQIFAQKYGGKCLSKDYINNKEKLLWECKEGHQWESVIGSVRRGHWCPKCKKAP